MILALNRIAAPMIDQMVANLKRFASLGLPHLLNVSRPKAASKAADTTSNGA